MGLKFIKTLVLASCLTMMTSVPMFVYSSNILENSYIVQSNQKTFTHTVGQGETVFSIARKYNLTVSDIYSLNPKAASALKVGDVLTIPNKGGVSGQNATSQPRTAALSQNDYVVKPKETLYSISKLFDVSIDDLISQNPGLRDSGLKDGQVIRIPAKKAANTSISVADVAQVQRTPSRFVEHHVTAQETIYGIARQYNLTADELMNLNPSLRTAGLKDGSILLIPASSMQSAGATNKVPVQETLTDINAINVGLILPILNKSDGQSARFLEYYEGFLLALSDMKAKGFSGNVYVFDMGSEKGTAKLKSLLDTYEMRTLDLIIGGVSPEQINIISTFAKQNGIKYAVPFPTKTNVASFNEQVYQVNTVGSKLYNSGAKAFVETFPGANVIIVNSTTTNDKSAFASELRKAGVDTKTVTANQNLVSGLESSLVSGRKNIIMPASGSPQVLQSLLPALNKVVENKPGLNISLFGHTEWQTYSQYFKDFSKYDTYIFTPFYLHEDDWRTRQFLSNYKKWYNDKSLVNTYPKYGVLGYDTGIYFLTMLMTQGKDFQNKVGAASPRTLQTPFSFTKSSPTGGYQNSGFYFIHYKPDGVIEKIEYTR